MQTLKQKSKKRYDKYLSKSNKSNVYGNRNWIITLELLPKWLCMSPESFLRIKKEQSMRKILAKFQMKELMATNNGRQNLVG